MDRDSIDAYGILSHKEKTSSIHKKKVVKTDK
jgi:hypothetical protein